MKDETSSVNMRYVGFVDTCVQMGMSKEAADRLYKSAASMKSLVGLVQRGGIKGRNAFLRLSAKAPKATEAAKAITAKPPVPVKPTTTALVPASGAGVPQRLPMPSGGMSEFGPNLQHRFPVVPAGGAKPHVPVSPALPEVVNPKVLPPARSTPAVRSTRMPAGDVIDAEYRMLPATRSQALGGLSRGGAHRLSLENARGFEAGPRPRLRGGVPPQRPTLRRVSRIKVPEGARRQATQQLATGQAPVTQAVMQQAPESLGMLARHPYLTLAGGALAGYGLNRFVNRDNY